MNTPVYVGRLPPRTTERDLDYFFRGYGRIEEIYLKNGFAEISNFFHNIHF